MATSDEALFELLAELRGIREQMKSLIRLYMEREREKEAQWKRMFAALSIIVGNGQAGDE